MSEENPSKILNNSNLDNSHASIDSNPTIMQMQQNVEFLKTAMEDLVK